MSVTYIVKGKQPLHGQVDAQGLPGAAVVGIAAALLTQDAVTLRRVPHLPALDRLLVELRSLGVAADWTHYHEITIKAAEVTPFPLLTVTQLLSKLPLLVAAVVMRCGVCRLELQSQDQSNLMDLMGLIRQFGGLVEVEEGLLRLAFPHCFGITTMSVAHFDVQTSLAAMLISSMAEGGSELSGLSQDPQVAALAAVMQSMGASASLEGAAWRCVGVGGLHGTSMSLPGDPMEAGLFGLATLATGGDVVVKGVVATQITGFLGKLRQMGGEYRVEPDNVRLRFWRESLAEWQPTTLEAADYPGIPSSWLPLFLPLLVQINGETSLQTVDTQVAAAVTVLKSLGAEFYVSDTQLRIFGPVRLAGGKMKVTGQADGLAALLAALSAKGVSEISGMEAVEGQFEHLSERLQKLGAKIERKEV